MIDYQKMYLLICAAASDALESLPQIIANSNGRAVLEQAMKQAEEIYIDSSDIY